MRASPLVVFVLPMILVAAPARAEDLATLGAAIDANPDDAKAYDAFALAAFKDKRWDDAIKRLKLGVARIPDYSEGYYKLAYAFRQKKEWADAADYYRRYISLNPTKTDPYFGLGASLEGVGDKKGAIAAYEKYIALEKSPQKQRFVDQAKQEMAKLSGNVETKMPVPSTLVNPPPPTSPTTAPPAGLTAAEARKQGDDFRKQGKLEEAAKSYEYALQLDKGNLDVYNDLGNVYFALKQYNEAARAFSTATSRDPNYALGWYNLAHALRKGDRPREAAEAYKQYIRLKPDDPDPYYGLGQTLKTLGDVPGAISAFQKYISMEKRPEEQRWVEKARAELQALQAMQGGGTSGRLDEKSSGGNVETAMREQLDRELKRDAVLPPSDDDLRLMDPFTNERVHDLKDPFRSEIVDPFAPSPSELTTSTQRLREYGAALAAYRRALERQAADVSDRFERGVAGVLAENPASAMRAWNAVPLDDPAVVAARRSVEQLRRALAVRR